MKEERNKSQQEAVTVSLLAGLDGDKQAVMEKVQAIPLEEEGCFQLCASPLFVRNLASGDSFKLLAGEREGEFALVQRSGKLAVRVFGKENISLLEQQFTPEVEKLDGSVDLVTEHALVYSLDVNIGFSAIESLFDGMMSSYPGSVWYYGNVYDPQDGLSPLNWWDEFINQT